VTVPTRTDPAEWKAFITQLDTVELTEAAEQANSPIFVQRMLAQGATAADVQMVLVLFALRFKELGFVPPAGGYVDLMWLADTQPAAPKRAKA
jgi:hypothetical protein